MEKSHRGIIQGLSFNQYLASPGVSQTNLKVFEKETPRKAKWMIEHPRPPSKAMELGTAVHHVLLEPPETFNDLVVIKPKFLKSGKGVTAAVKAEIKVQEALWDAHHVDRVVVGTEQRETLVRMYDSVYNFNNWMKEDMGLDIFCPQSKNESSVFWVEQIEITKGVTQTVECRARLDQIHKSGVTLDVKTTRSAQLDEFMRSAYKFGYDFQCAHYLSGLSEFMETNTDMYLILAVENEPPYDCALFTYNQETINHALGRVKACMHTYATCMATNEWPGYPKEIQTLGLPDWAM